MKKMLYLPAMIIGCTAFATGSYAGNNCPEVNLDNLQRLACANGLSSFSGDMKYSSDKVSGATCAVNLGLKKTWQALLKGSKTYPTTEKIVQKGILECHYDFPADWKTYLNATNSSFAIVTEIANRISRGMVKGNLCPKMTFQALKQLKEGKIMSVKAGLIQGGHTLDWELKGEIPTKFRVLNTNKEPSETTKVSGQGLIKKPFVHTCAFTSKAIGSEVTLTGTQQSE